MWHELLVHWSWMLSEPEQNIQGQPKHAPTAGVGSVIKCHASCLCEQFSMAHSDAWTATGLMWPAIVTDHAIRATKLW